MPDSEKKSASLLRPVYPKFISVVDSPANQSAFKVIRSTEDSPAPSKGNALKKRTRRTAPVTRNAEGLLSITLPSTASREEAESVMAQFGLEDDYGITENGDSFALVRLGIPDDASIPATPIPLEGDMWAYVADTTLYRGLPAQSVESTKTDTTTGDSSSGNLGVVMVGLEFDEAFFETNRIDRGLVGNWLKERNIAIEDNRIETVEGGIVATRYDTDKQSRKLSIQQGVKAVVVRSTSANNDVPKSISRAVTSEAFGNWGWGHVDFIAALADPEYCDKSYLAISTLYDVLETILFYSKYSLDERKTLMKEALDQYGAFMENLIDSLPRTVLEAVQGNFSRSDRLETDMSINIQKQAKVDLAKDPVGDEPVKRADAPSDTLDAKPENAPSIAASSEDDKTEVIVRKVLQELKKENQTADKTAAKSADASKEADGSSDAGEAVQRSDAGPNALLDSINKIAESMETMVKRQEKILTEITGETQIRSDESDEGAPRTDEGPQDVMRGALGTCGGMLR